MSKFKFIKKFESFESSDSPRRTPEAVEAFAKVVKDRDLKSIEAALVSMVDFDFIDLLDSFMVDKVENDLFYLRFFTVELAGLSGKSGMLVKVENTNDFIEEVKNQIHDYVINERWQESAYSWRSAADSPEEFKERLDQIFISSFKKIDFYYTIDIAIDVDKFNSYLKDKYLKNENDIESFFKDFSSVSEAYKKEYDKKRNDMLKDLGSKLVKFGYNPTAGILPERIYIDRSGYIMIFPLRNKDIQWPFIN